MPLWGPEKHLSEIADRQKKLEKTRVREKETEDEWKREKFDREQALAREMAGKQYGVGTGGYGIGGLPNLSRAAQLAWDKEKYGTIGAAKSAELGFQQRALGEQTRASRASEGLRGREQQRLGDVAKVRYGTGIPYGEEGYGGLEFARQQADIAKGLTTARAKEFELGMESRGLLKIAGLPRIIRRKTRRIDEKRKNQRRTFLWI